MSIEFKGEENDNEYLIPMLRKNSEYVMNKNNAHIEPGVVLTYPKNYNFISKLPKPFIKSLIKHGWNTEKTIFLEIPYIVTFTLNFDPSFVQTWLTVVHSNNHIFRAVAFTKGYVGNSHVIELEDTIMHEQLHIKEDEPRLLKGYGMNQEYLSNESRVEHIVDEVLFKKYGNKIFQIKQDAIIVAFETQKNTKTIMSGVMEYWIHLFFAEKFNEYNEFGIPMNNKLESQDFINDTKQVNESILNLYNTQFGVELKSLI